MYSPTVCHILGILHYDKNGHLPQSAKKKLALESYLLNLRVLYAGWFCTSTSHQCIQKAARKEESIMSHICY